MEHQHMEELFRVIYVFVRWTKNGLIQLTELYLYIFYILLFLLFLLSYVCNKTVLRIVDSFSVSKAGSGRSKPSV